MTTNARAFITTALLDTGVFIVTSPCKGFVLRRGAFRGLNKGQELSERPAAQLLSAPPWIHCAMVSNSDRATLISPAEPKGIAPPHLSLLLASFRQSMLPAVSPGRTSTAPATLALQLADAGLFIRFA